MTRVTKTLTIAAQAAAVLLVVATVDANYAVRDVSPHELTTDGYATPLYGYRLGEMIDQLEGRRTDTANPSPQRWDMRDGAQELALIFPSEGVSACAASGCAASACAASGCAASGCAGSGCGGSACGGSACGASACVGSACGGSGCVGSGCGGSACGGSACAGSACGGSACGGSACGGSGCVGSSCGGSGCVGSACGVSICVGSACSLSACGGSVCTQSGCAGSVCGQSGCVGSVCKGCDATAANSSPNSSLAGFDVTPVEGDVVRISWIAKGSPTPYHLYRRFAEGEWTLVQQGISPAGRLMSVTDRLPQGTGGAAQAQYAIQLEDGVPVPPDACPLREPHA